MSWYDNLKVMRKRKGLTQEQLALLSVVSTATIHTYESGESNPKLDTLQKIAKALDTDLSTLFDEVKVPVQSHTLSELFVSNPTRVLPNLRPCFIEEHSTVTPWISNELVRNLLLEGMGICTDSEIISEMQRFRDVATWLRKEGYCVIKESTNLDFNRLSYSVALITETMLHTELSGVMEYEENCRYSKCSVSVSPYSHLSEMGICIPERCGLTVIKGINEITIASDIMCVPRTPAGKNLYVSRITGYHLYFC